MGVGEVFGHRVLSGAIARRLFVQALLLSLLAIVVISALQMVFRYREKLTSIAEEFERIEASQLKSIAASLWLSDEALMRTQLEGLLNLPHIQFAEVRSAEGPRISLGSPVANDRIERDYPLLFPHRGSEIEIGRLVVHASPDRIHRELLHELGPLALGEAGKILVTAFLAFILFQLTVGRHLSSLARQSRDLDPAKPGSRFSLDRPAEKGRAADELEVLVQALNLLYGRLAGTIAELRRTNERLDAEIAERRQAEQALRKSEALLAKATENAPGMIYQFLLRPDGSAFFPYVSAWCQTMFGIPPETLSEDAAALLDRILPEDRPGFEASVARSVDTMTNWRWEGRLRAANGEVVWHQGISKPERQADGGILWSGFFFDITERKRIERSLQREQEFIRALLESMLDGVVACDAEGRLALFNRAAREWHGLDPLQIPQEEWGSRYDLFAEDGITPLTAETVPLARAYRGERLHDTPLVIRAKGQPLRYVTSNCAPFYDNEGQLLGAVAVMRDLTEARRVQLALKESEERFRQVVESAPVPIGVYHASGRIEYFNPKLEETFGYSLAEVANVDQWFEKVYPDPVYRQVRRGVWKDALATAAQKGDPGGDGGIEANVTCRDGSVRVMQVFDVLMGDRRLAVFSDLTERMRSEEALRASLAEKETLLKEVHHRVKNNLQVISSLMSLQFRQARGADPRVFLQDTQNRIRSMAMVHEILYRSGSISKVGFSEYVGSLCEHLARSYGAAARGIRLTPRIAEAFLDLDQAIVAGLIVNELVTNAMKHAFGSRPEGDIRVELQAAGDGHLALRVADNGVGMPAGELPAAAGTLGLLLVKNLAQQLDGELTVRRDHGTVLEIVFPRKPHVNGVDE